jgi:hypothetical protein
MVLLVLLCLLMVCFVAAAQGLLPFLLDLQLVDYKGTDLLSVFPYTDILFLVNRFWDDQRGNLVVSALK